MKDKLTSFATWVNENIVGSEWTYAICIVFVIAIFLLIPIQGYSKWNLTTGLFSNTLESSFELITGVGAVVGVVSLHNKHKANKKSLDDLHAKVDKLTGQSDE